MTPTREMLGAPDLCAQDDALARGRQQQHDWTGPLGTPLPPPVMRMAEPEVTSEPNPIIGAVWTLGIIAFAILVGIVGLVVGFVVLTAGGVWWLAKAAWRALPRARDAAEYYSEAVGDAIAWHVARFLWRIELKLLRWQVISHIAIEVPGSPYRHLPPLVTEAPELAFELDLGAADPFRAIDPATV